MTERLTYSCSLVSQGKHRFYTLTMPSDVLAKTCTVDTRADDAIEGFQRKLDERRAQEIADYIDGGLGTIPSSIVLSAQPDAHLQYTNSRRSITFDATARSFLILDGQHRVFGFSKAKTKLRVPVVIYNNLSRTQECRLFIDINTKQRPVPNELLLDIKRLAEMESGDEPLLRDVFDRFASDPKSPLLAMMSPSAKAKGKLSRVTFNAALKSIASTLEDADAESAYETLAAYLDAWTSRLRTLKAADKLVNPVAFRAIVLLFPDVAQRVSDRYGNRYSSTNFTDVLEPVFQTLTASSLRNPGKSHVALYEKYQKTLRRQFTIGA
jgi:DGQHR domain-containing protein